MKGHSINYLIINLLLVFILTFYCQKSSTPLSDDIEQIIQLQIIPREEVPRNWDETYYQHRSEWVSFFDTTSADSVANILKDVELPVSNMWFPNVNYKDIICTIPIRRGSEVILKLTKSDTNIHKYGFMEHDGFPIECVQEWRHYKFIQVLN